MLKRIFTTTTLVAAFGVAWPSFAQAPKPTETPTTPVKIKRTETVAADNWTITCSLPDQPSAKWRCAADTKLAQTENNVQRVVFTWTIADQDGKLLSVVSVPPGVLIGPGVQLRVNDKDVRKIVFSLCQPDHCEAAIPLDDDLQKTLIAAPTAEFSVVATNGVTVKFSAATKGIEEAITAIAKTTAKK